MHNLTNVACLIKKRYFERGATNTRYSKVNILQKRDTASVITDYYYYYYYYYYFYYLCVKSIVPLLHVCIGYY